MGFSGNDVHCNPTTCRSENARFRYTRTSHTKLVSHLEALRSHLVTADVITTDSVVVHARVWIQTDCPTVSCLMMAAMLPC